MLSGRLYRAAFLPLVPVLAIAAFSLSARPPAPTSTLAPDAFDGAAAFAELSALASEFPDRAPGSRSDRALAARVAQTLNGLGGTAGGGFRVRRRRFEAQTIAGERTLETVLAERPCSTGATPIVVLAHRDAAAAGPARAELSGTAALLELARVFAARETKRTIILLSTSGGSGGDGGAADFAANRSLLDEHGPLDAAIALGDVASARASKPLVVPYSDGFGSAPSVLQRTVSDALAREAGSDPGSPSAFGQLAHLAFSLTVGEQGALNSAGIPAVLIQASGERGPSAKAAVSPQRLEGLGRSALSAIDALDAAPDVPAGKQTGVVVQRMTIPAWAIRLLVGVLLLPALLVGADALARARRRTGSSTVSGTGGSVRRSLAWVLSCAAPFAAAALFARVLGATGSVVAPATPVPPTALSIDGGAARAVLAVSLFFALGWLCWPLLLRRLGLAPRPDAQLAGLAAALVLHVLCAVAWVANPYTALLLLVPAHVALLLASPQLRPRPRAALALVALGALPLALIGAFYAHELGLGPARVAWMAVLLLAGGHIGVPASIFWSLILGCGVAAVRVALSSGRPRQEREQGGETVVTIRGPLTYAGPGSLGGTESALRR